MKKNYLLFLSMLLVVCSCSDDENASASASTNPTLTTTDFSTSIEENPLEGQVLGTVAGESSEGAINFSIISQTPDGAFLIDAETGELRVENAVFFDYEAYPQMEGVVEVTSGQLTENVNILVSLIDVFEVECDPNGSTNENNFYAIHNGSNMKFHGSLFIHQFTFSFNGTDRVICKVGVWDLTEGNFTIEIIDSNGNILYTGDHQFEINTMNLVDIDPIQIIAGEQYTVRRISDSNSGSGAVFNDIALPVGLSFMTVHSSKFFGDGFELEDVGIPYISFGFAD